MVKTIIENVESGYYMDHQQGMQLLEMDIEAAIDAATIKLKQRIRYLVAQEEDLLADNNRFRDMIIEKENSSNSRNTNTKD